MWGVLHVRLLMPALRSRPREVVMLISRLANYTNLYIATLALALLGTLVHRFPEESGWYGLTSSQWILTSINQT